MFAFICGVQLALDSLDRLVDTLEERGPLTPVEAARSLFATPSISEGLAGSLLTDLTAGDRVGIPWLSQTCGRVP